MSRFAMTADIHFGVPKRLADINWACRVVAAYCEEQNIETVVNLGDTAHDRSALGIDVYCSMHDFFSGVRSRGQRWITFLGNHDMFLKHAWDVNSVRPLSKVLDVIEDIKILKIGGQRFWVLPFIQLERSYMRVLAKIEEQYEEGDTLLTHIGVRGSILNTCFLLKDWSFVDFAESKFQRVYTGHFHSHQNVDGKVWYPGSLIPFKFDEGDTPHGFLVYDTARREHEFVDLWKVGPRLLPGETPPPQFMTVLDEQVQGLDPADVAGNIVRVALGRDYQHDEKAQIRASILEMGANSVAWLHMNLEPDRDRRQVTAIKTLNPGDLFKRFMEENRPKDIDTKLALKLDVEVRAEGDERYSYAEQD